MNAIYLWLWALASTGTSAQPHCLRTRYSVSVHMSLPFTKCSHCVGSGSPVPMGRPSLGPQCRGKKCWSDRQLDGGGSHPGLGICQLGDQQLPVQRGCGKGFDFLRLLSKWLRIACTMSNVFGLPFFFFQDRVSLCNCLGCPRTS